MKKVIVLLFLVLFVGHASEPIEKSVVKRDISSEVRPKIKIQVSYDYIEDISMNFEEVLMYGSFFKVPRNLVVSKGSSYEQMLSLIIGERKFCYQGHGDEFIYIGELVSLSDKCSSEHFEDFNDEKVYAEYGDLIVGKIQNNNCDESCVESQVKFELSPVHED